MLEVVVVLAIIALVVLFFRAGRQNTIVYRRKVANYDRERVVTDQPQTSNTSSDSWFNSDSSRESVSNETFAFGGGDFGGAGAGDSYDTGTGDSYDTGTTDWNSNDSASISDSGSCDSSSCDSSSDSSGNDSSGSDSSWSSSD